jgi:hypothetical protein
MGRADITQMGYFNNAPLPFDARKSSPFHLLSWLFIGQYEIG